MEINMGISRRHFIFSYCGLKAAGRGGGEKCGVCGKSVYAAERQEAGKIIYHKLCFKCSECKMSLKLNNYAQADKVLYCKKHYQEIVVAKNTQSTNVY